jgi:hypothetical protein
MFGAQQIAGGTAYLLQQLPAIRSCKHNLMALAKYRPISEHQRRS